MVAERRVGLRSFLAQICNLLHQSTSVQQFLGVANAVEKYCSDIAEMTSSEIPHPQQANVSMRLSQELCNDLAKVRSDYAKAKSDSALGTIEDWLCAPGHIAPVRTGSHRFAPACRLVGWLVGLLVGCTVVDTVVGTGSMIGTGWDRGWDRGWGRGCMGPGLAPAALHRLASVALVARTRTPGRPHTHAHTRAAARGFEHAASKGGGERAQ